MAHVLVLVASTKTPVQSLLLVLCSRRERVSPRLDLVAHTHSSTERSQRRAQKHRTGRNGQLCQSSSRVQLICHSSSDPAAAYLRQPGSGQQATRRLSPVPPGPQHDMAARPIVPRRAPGSHEMWLLRPRPAPFFWPAVVSSMERPVPFDQNPCLPPSRCPRYYCCRDCDFCDCSFD